MSPSGFLPAHRNTTLILYNFDFSAVLQMLEKLAGQNFDQAWLKVGLALKLRSLLGKD